MILLKKYTDFLDRVDELGFMTLSDILPGFPALSEETPKEIWHTGDPDTDPWCWKDRAAEEKRLAYGCILGGNRGFVSARIYPICYKVCHPDKPMEERRASGQVSQTIWQLWRIFEEKTLLNTSDIRQEMGVTLKKGGSKVDKATKELQQFYYIAVAGSRYRIGKDTWHMIMKSKHSMNRRLHIKMELDNISGKLDSVTGKIGEFEGQIGGNFFDEAERKGYVYILVHQDMSLI